MNSTIANLDYWLQRTLPQVYDDSLSFSELLGKVLAKLNEVIDTTNEFFSDDHIAQHVNDRLAEWEADGTLESLINVGMIGTLGELQTNYKDDLVGAINENTSKLADFSTNKISLSKITGLKNGYIAHRGYSDLAPENTIPAYLEAYKHGQIVVETDIQKTSDGKWVLMHDTTVDRTTNGTGAVSTMTLAQIQALNVDFVPTWYFANPAGYYGTIKVPTLEEFLNVCSTFKLVPQIEVQGWFDRVADATDLVNIIKKYRMEEKCCIFSADIDFVKEVRKNSSKVYTMLTRTTLTQSDIDLALSVGNCGIDTALTDINKNTVELAHSQGVEIACYTIDSQHLADAYFDYGVDWIATNRLTRGEKI